ncbi:MAG: 16S rRNA (uracil(1498)-N(3))-methyltransferase [Deltaproteobacteria bacterium]|nr:16S rRNA (uracil(1498)-N(3))-methyltransferase [Deltaproteobacteria bacterium]
MPRTRPPLRRFFAPPDRIQSGWATLEGSEAHHLRVTLRIKSGTEILILDGEGGAYEGLVEETGKDRIRVRLIGRRRVDTESQLDLGLALAMIRNEKMKWILQKATELGVSEIKPFYTPRSVVLSGKDGSHWLERSQRILIEALKQCGRVRLPRLSPPVDFNTFLSEVSATHHGILLWEKPCTPFKEVLEAVSPESRIMLVVGPEGGFDTEEVAAAARMGFATAHLGSRVLRAETAALSAMAIVQYRFGDLGNPLRGPGSASSNLRRDHYEVS